ncbi:MAG: AlkZ family DNA glycosylase [Acidimicrobiia bacterium]|nr:AlkZ family DNA glycosylase [Acidimicrobiia bacterium]
MRRVGVEERRARLARRHHLATTARASDVVDVARDLVGLHGTDPASIFVSAAVRMKKPSIAAVERALYEDRTLLRMLGMRRTLFVEPLDLVPVVQSAASHAVAVRERARLVKFLTEAEIAQDPGKWLRRVEKAAVEALRARGDATAAQLGADVPDLGKKLVLSRGKKYEAEVSISSRVLLLLAAEGRVVRAQPRGSWISTQYRWTTPERWLGSPIVHLPVDEARGALVRRWLRAFGPGTLTDLKWWTGWSAGEVRKALTSIEPVEAELDGGAVGLMLADDVAPVRSPKPWVKLTPSLDATTMGWKDREWYLGAHGSEVFDRIGNAGPAIWCDGRIVGGWAQRRDGEIAYRLLEDIGREATAAVEAAAEAVGALVGDIRYTPRFPTPLERALRG